MEPERNVHTEHCSPDACKYGDKACTVRASGPNSIIDVFDKSWTAKWMGDEDGWHAYGPKRTTPEEARADIPYYVTQTTDGSIAAEDFVAKREKLVENVRRDTIERCAAWIEDRARPEWASTDVGPALRAQIPLIQFTNEDGEREDG